MLWYSSGSTLAIQHRQDKMPTSIHSLYHSDTPTEYRNFRRFNSSYSDTSYSTRSSLSGTYRSNSITDEPLSSSSHDREISTYGTYYRQPRDLSKSRSVSKSSDSVTKSSPALTSSAKKSYSVTPSYTALYDDMRKYSPANYKTGSTRSKPEGRPPRSYTTTPRVSISSSPLSLTSSSLTLKSRQEVTDANQNNLLEINNGDSNLNRVSVAEICRKFDNFQRSGENDSKNDIQDVSKRKCDLESVDHSDKAVIDNTKVATVQKDEEKSSSEEPEPVAGASIYEIPATNLETAVNGSPSSIKLQTSSSQDNKGLVGLKNIGNTCFMNSIVQCLSNTRLLMEYITSQQYLTDIRSDCKGALMKAFGELIQNIWQASSCGSLNTGSFKSQVQRYAPRFDGYLQHDAQEFLRYLLEGLHEDINRVAMKPKTILPDISDDLSDNQKAQESWKRYLRTDDSKIVDIFVGQLKSTLQCTYCKHCSTTFEAFWDLSLSLPKTSGKMFLTQCLDLFTSEETLDGDEMPTCSKCKCRRKCKKRFLIHKFPQVLVLHLKRFSPSERYRKVSVNVDFPVNGLDMSPYAAQSHIKAEYNLYALANHNGTASSGHYTAYCKHPHSGNWNQYNDGWVTPQSSNDLVSASAYVLFYEQISSTRL